MEEAGIIEGRNAVIEAFRAGVVIDKVFLTAGTTEKTLCYIASVAKNAGSLVVDADNRKLDKMSITKSHQGVIAHAATIEYSEISDIFQNAKSKDKPPLIVLCDEISDPQNLGAIIRTSEAVGVDGVIITKHRSAGITPAVARASSGALYHIPIVRVTNLSATISELKNLGVWIYGTTTHSENVIWQTDFTGPTAIVIGSEGSGIGRLVAENCDYLVSIPMYGKLSSLNVSVSAAVVLYEVLRQRGDNDNKGEAVNV